MKTDQRPHLEFLDGMRGLSALYVMIGHAYIYIRLQLDTVVPSLALKLLKLLDLGHYAVAIFIVLSGYCLMLPIAHSATGTLAGGWFGYISRRARRIMPAFYAALALSILMVMIFPQVAEPGDLSWGSITTHLLLINNLFPSFLHSLNGPMWSVAMEWQIYFLLPLVLLPIWRRFGNLAVLLVGLTLGFAPILLLPASYNFEWTNPWYIGLFAMGMVAAAISFSSRSATWLRERMPWRWLTLILAALTAYLLFFNLRWSWEHRWFSDCIMGLTVASAIVLLAQHTMAARQPTRTVRGLNRPLDLPVRAIIHLLESPWVAGLGACSYSLYLLHEPLLVLSSSYLLALKLPLIDLLAAQFLVGVPITLMLCYLFYLVFERPFVKQRRVRSPSASAAVPVQEQGGKDELEIMPAPLVATPGVARSDQPKDALKRGN